VQSNGSYGSPRAAAPAGAQAELEKQVQREAKLAEAEGKTKERRQNEDIYRRWVGAGRPFPSFQDFWDFGGRDIWCRLAVGAQTVDVVLVLLAMGVMLMLGH
jgi:hypothetical protein